MKRMLILKRCRLRLIKDASDVLRNKIEKQTNLNINCIELFKFFK